MSIQTYFDRALAALGQSTVDAGAGGSLRQARQRLETAAEDISRAGNAQAHLDVAESAILGLLAVLYQPDTDGQPANYDRRTGRILVPLPWGSGGWRQWGMRKWEAWALRQIMIRRSFSRRRPPLFDYNSETHTWHLNTADYPTIEAAAQWVQKEGPTLEEWRLFTDAHRQAAAARMVAKRSAKR